MKRIYVINADNIKRAVLKGNYVFCCNSCLDLSASWKKPFEILVDTKTTKLLQSQHDILEDHHWVIKSESVLSKSKIREVKRHMKKKEFRKLWQIIKP